MDKAGDREFSANDGSVSTIPSATPITSEIISDFEPDPKFEITPLEKATFDCNDLFLQDNNSSELAQQSENGKQEQYESQGSGNVLVSQDSGVQQTSSDEKEPDARPTTTKKGRSGIKHPVDSQGVSGKSCENSEHLTTSSNDISSKINDCPSSSGRHESDADHLTATISVEESIAASALVQVAEGQAMKGDPIEPQNAKDSNTDRQQQYSAIETPHQADRIQAAEESEHANYLYSLSQTSVDAQMEKVIENIVELGEGHEFSHSLSQVEDREKLLESIHREITSVQSSIDLIADVASKQQSIEISPTEQLRKPVENAGNQKEPNNSAQYHNTDLKTSKTLTTRAEDKPSPLDNAVKVQTDDTIEMNVPMEAETVGNRSDNITKASEIESCEPTELLEVKPKPIIEEPLAPSDLEAADTELEKLEPKEDKKEEVSVEPLESADEAVEPLNSEPVIEEAPSADESDANQADKESINGKESAEMPLKRVSKELSVEVETEESSAIADTGRRKSGRRVKAVVRETVEVSNTEELRKSSRRLSSRKRPIEVEQPTEMKVVTEMEQHKVPKDETNNVSDTNQNISSDYEKGSEREIEKVEQVNESRDEDIGEARAKKADAVEDVMPEPMDEAVRRPSRSLRVRAPKRLLEEESPKADLPKKQVKRSRGASDDLNRSSEPSRSTPTIKLPTLKSRMTISTSDPSSRPGAHKERVSVTLATDKKYVCHQCGFATDRLNNMVYHSTKSYCEGKTEMAEMMKNDIIKQQQAKKRRQMR